MNIAKKEDILNAGQEWMDKEMIKSQELNNVNSATIHLSTLDRFVDTKPGSYAMTSMKKMTGTSSFLDLPENIKDCQIEDQPPRAKGRIGDCMAKPMLYDKTHTA